MKSLGRKTIDPAAARTLAASFTLALVAMLAGCGGADGEAILGSSGASSGGDEPMTPQQFFAAMAEEEPREGIVASATPGTVEIDPCDPETPTDPETGALLGTTTLGAVVRDAELEPLVGVEVVFSASAGSLESEGMAVLTDETGLAMDVLTVDETLVGDVEVTITSGDDSETVVVSVVRLERPPITLSMEPAELWPPNHKMRTVEAVFGGLECEPAPEIELVSVESDEPDDGIGDGSTVGDIAGASIGTFDTDLDLRAERSGTGSGRVYTVVYRVIDAEGVESMLEGEVVVPHDQGDDEDPYDPYE